MSLFCFKQKTAYEMRISDWSSDACSSDLAYCVFGLQGVMRMLAKMVDIQEAQVRFLDLVTLVTGGTEVILTKNKKPVMRLVPIKIGRASCRERVCQYV